MAQLSDINRAKQFYATLLESAGAQVFSGLHYFGCGGTILACCDPRADGDPWDATPNPDHVYFAVDDLEATLQHSACAPVVLRSMRRMLRRRTT